jgi:hypothetical protein
MTTQAEVRRIALSLPEATEQDHHGMRSFGVRGRIFATVPDDQHVRIMADEGEIHAAVAADPAVYEAFYWGTRLACVVADVDAAAAERLHDLLVDAWIRKAPKSIAAKVDEIVHQTPPPDGPSFTGDI